MIWQEIGQTYVGKYIYCILKTKELYLQTVPDIIWDFFIPLSYSLLWSNMENDAFTPNELFFQMSTLSINGGSFTDIFYLLLSFDYRLLISSWFLCRCLALMLNQTDTVLIFQSLLFIGGYQWLRLWFLSEKFQSE